MRIWCPARLEVAFEDLGYRRRRHSTSTVLPSRDLQEVWKCDRGRILRRCSADMKAVEASVEELEKTPRKSVIAGRSRRLRRSQLTGTMTIGEIIADAMDSRARTDSFTVKQPVRS